VVEPSAAERAIGRRAAESRATVPGLELSVELGNGAQRTTGRLIEACASALREHPRANAAYRDGHFELYSRVNVGVVVADGERYLIPNVFDADTRSAAELEDEVARISREALAGELSASAFSGATFTIWDAGRLGVASASLPVVPPQAAALTAGNRALTLSCDHRILYGALATAFLASVSSRLESG
jgi:pyruvate dehydrogenase E2 component (dihydrolipoamide acetyltransferase)